MSDNPHEPCPLDERFAEAAEGMDLELETDTEVPSSCFGIGVVPMIGVEHIVHIPAGENSPPVTRADHAAISDLLHRWESAHPHDLIDTWRSLAPSPFVAVGCDWVAPLTFEFVAEAIESEAMRRALEEYPPFNPRRVRIFDESVVFIGNSKAAVTYRIEEAYQNGKLFVGNAAVILMKDANGDWKMAVFTKHNRHDDFLEVAYRSYAG